MNNRPRLLISIAVAGLVYILLPFCLRLPARIIITWTSTMNCTVFAMHYAYDYYRADRSMSLSEVKAGGLDFPNENQPDYTDEELEGLIV